MEVTLTDVLALGWLVLLEGLLSVDNALVLAAMVSVLPVQKQRRALLYGIIGAYVFRVSAILFAVWLLKIWWFQLAGGLYLLFIAWQGLRQKEDKKRSPGQVNFWLVVAQVELMDAAFSIDSILAAVALSQKLWVVIAGGVMGILLMRIAASFFIRFLEKHPLFKKTAYVLVALIGLKLSAHPWWHMPEVPFFSLLAAICLGTYLLERRKTRQDRR